MTLHKLVYLPDQRLRAPTQEITVFDDKLRTLIDDMIETMYEENGVGLAAPQIGLSLRLAVIDVSEERNKPFCIINPVITEKEGEELMHAGCLSVPGVYDSVPRAIKIKMRAQDRNGEFFEMSADGLLSHCIQHEIDHLYGKLFVDYLSPLKKQLARKKLEKYKRHHDL